MNFNISLLLHVFKKLNSTLIFPEYQEETVVLLNNLKIYLCNLVMIRVWSNNMWHFMCVSAYLPFWSTKWIYHRSYSNLQSVHKTFNICCRIVTKLKRNNMSITEEDKSEGRKGTWVSEYLLDWQVFFDLNKARDKTPTPKLQLYF